MSLYASHETLNVFDILRKLGLRSVREHFFEFTFVGTGLEISPVVKVTGLPLGIHTVSVTTEGVSVDGGPRVK